MDYQRAANRYQPGYCAAAVAEPAFGGSQCARKDTGGGLCGTHRNYLVRRGHIALHPDAPKPQYLTETRTSFRLLQQVEQY